MNDSQNAAGVSAKSTVIEVVYPPHRGVIGLRGSRAPLSWMETLRPTRVDDDRHVFELSIADGEVIELEVVRDEKSWYGGRNYAVHAGDNLQLEPFFDHESPTVVPVETLETAAGALAVEVLLPRSYEEQERKRYPVLYALDEQSLFTHSRDPFGVWSLDATLAQLDDVGATEEMIVVAVHTSDRRLERLSPVPDEKHGGGEGRALVTALVDTVLPYVDQKYRTRRGREATALMGSSLGGLFAFFAAFERPEVFGRAVCLSSSFWWANRWAVRWVQSNPAPYPRPWIYLDSGASLNALERDASVRDGFHHTRAMVRALTALGYEPGSDLHGLVFTGARHEAAAWAERIAIPLQLLFPREPRVPRVPP